MFKQVSLISYVFLKAVNESELTVSLPEKAPLIAKCSSGKDSLHGAEKKALLLGQLYVGPNSLWALFVTVIVQFMYCLVLWLYWHASATFLFFAPTTIYMLKSLLHPPHGFALNININATCRVLVS